MSIASDEHFLRAWAERADEAAFSALVGRYAGFIYGAALRRVGDEGLAQEITQDVFARLSQNAARLAGHPALSGWLHRTAMLVGLARLRQRRRSAARLAHLSQMTTPAADPLAEALPHLDAALDQLAPREREVLILHFFDRLTFPEIATRLRTTPAAARMRSTRALSALSTLLRKKGISLPAATLTAGLSATLTQAAPATLAILPAALAGAGKVSALTIIIHSLQTMKLAKATALAALALILATPLVFQQQQIAAAEVRIAALREWKAVSGDAAVVFENTRTQSARGIDIQKLGTDALDGSYPAFLRIRETIGRLDNNNLAGLIQTVLQTKMLPFPREVLLGNLLNDMRKRDTALFLEWTMKSVAQMREQDIGISGSTGAMLNKALDAFRDWVAAQPARAADWMEKNKEAWVVFTRDTSDLEQLITSGFLLSSDPQQAFARMEKMSAQQCVSIYWSSWLSMDTSRKIELARWASKSPDVEKRRRIVAVAISSCSQSAFDPGGELERQGAILRGLEMGSADLRWCALLLAMNSPHRINDETTGITRVDMKRVESILEWIETIVPANDVTYARGALGHLLPAPDALNFLNSELEQSHSDELIAGYVESEKIRWEGAVEITPTFIQRGETAFRFAMRTRDSERRVKLLVRAWTDFHKQSPKAAREILKLPELSDSDRAAVEAQVAPLLKDKP